MGPLSDAELVDRKARTRFVALTGTLSGRGRIPAGIGWENIAQPEYFAFAGLDRAQGEVVIKALENVSAKKKPLLKAVKTTPDATWRGWTDQLLDRLIAFEEGQVPFDAVAEYCTVLSGIGRAKDLPGQAGALQALDEQWAARPAQYTPKRTYDHEVVIAYHAPSGSFGVGEVVEGARALAAKPKYHLSEDDVFEVQHQGQGRGQVVFAEGRATEDNERLTAAMGRLTQNSRVTVVGHGSFGGNIISGEDGSALAAFLKERLPSGCEINLVGCFGMPRDARVRGGQLNRAADSTVATTVQLALAADGGPHCPVTSRRLAVTVSPTGEDRGHKTVMHGGEHDLPRHKAPFSKIRTTIDDQGTQQHKYHIYAPTGTTAALPEFTNPNDIPEELRSISDRLTPETWELCRQSVAEHPAAYATLASAYGPDRGAPGERRLIGPPSDNKSNFDRLLKSNPFTPGLLQAAETYPEAFLLVGDLMTQAANRERQPVKAQEGMEDFLYAVDSEVRAGRAPGIVRYFQVINDHPGGCVHRYQSDPFNHNPSRGPVLDGPFRGLENVTTFREGLATAQAASGLPANINIVRSTLQTGQAEQRQTQPRQPAPQPPALRVNQPPPAHQPPPGIQQQ